MIHEPNPAKGQVFIECQGALGQQRDSYPIKAVHPPLCCSGFHGGIILGLDGDQPWPGTATG